MKSFFSLLLIVLFSLSFNSCGNDENKVKLFPVKSGDKWGYVNRQGNIVINPQFDGAFNYSEGLALVKTEGKYGYIGEDGKYVVNPIYKDANKFSEGLACVVMENGKPQIINKAGKILFTVDKADMCFGFSEGMALVKIKGKWGYIDKTGKIVINAIYEDGNTFSEGLACVAKLDDKTKKKKWGYIDKKGSVKIEFQFESGVDKLFCDPGSFGDGLAFVSTDGKKWGCINNDGKYQINPQFDREEFSECKFKNKIAVIKQSASYGYIDKNGKYIINPQFKTARNFSYIGYAAVQNSDGKWGFIDKEGKYVVNPQFDGIESGFINDIAFVKSSDKYGIIDSKGLYVVNPQFDDVQLFDLDYIMGVTSDYIDNDELADEVFANSSVDKYLDYGKQTTLGEIISSYPETNIDNLKSTSLSIDHPKIVVSDILKISSLTFGFNDKTYTETPIYKTESTYDYYSGRYYPRQVFDRFDKKINSSPTVTYVSLSLELQNTDTGKVKALAIAFKNKALKVLEAKEKETTDVVNSSFKGLFFLTNNNNLIWISYSQAKGDKKVNPAIGVIVINKNFDTDFDELQKRIVEKFRNNES
jgi:hypothetical protein